MSIILKENNIENYDIMSLMNKQVFNHSHLGVLPVFIKGKYYYFLLDSGANNNVLCTSIFDKYPEFRELKVIKINDYIAAGSTENVSSNIVTAEIIIGDLHLKECPFQCIDLSLGFSDILEDCNIEVIGIIGMRFLNHFKLIVDFDDLIIYNKIKPDMKNEDFIYLNDELYLRPLISLNDQSSNKVYKLKGIATSINNKNLDENNEYCLTLNKKIKLIEGNKIPNTDKIIKKIHFDIKTNTYLIEIE